MAEDSNTSTSRKLADITLGATNTVVLGGVDATYFEVQGNALYLKAGVVLNHEAQQQLAVTLIVVPLGGGDALASQIYTLAIADVNEAPTALTLSASSVAENNVVGVVVASLTATDPDGSGSAFASPFTYSLVTGAGDSDNAAFSIEGNQLKLNASANFEAQSSYSVRLRATDAGGLSHDAVKTIAVGDLNDAPTAVTFSAAVTSLSESASTVARTRVADIVVSDDATDNTSLVLGGADASSFELLGRALYLKAGVSLSNATKASYAVTVIASDSTVAASVPVSAAYLLNVVSANSAPSAVVLSNVTSALLENSSSASRIKLADIAVTDDGMGASNVSLTGTDAGNFELYDGDLYLRRGVALNYERKSSYSVTVNVADLSVVKAPVSAAYNLSITNVNEAPTALSLSNVVSSLAENVNTSARIKVAEVVIADDGLGINVITLSGADATNFEVIDRTLYLIAGAALSQLNKPSYAVTVSVADALAVGGGAMSSSFSLNISAAAVAPTAQISGLTLTDDFGLVGSGASTNDHTIRVDGRLSGTINLAGGEVVQVYDGQTLLGNATVTGTTDGNWTFTTSTLVAGAHTLNARVVHPVSGLASIQSSPASASVVVSGMSDLSVEVDQGRVSGLDKVRYIMLKQTGAITEYLWVNEVEVMSNGVNVALGKPVSASSYSVSNANYSAGYVTNGNLARDSSGGYAAGVKSTDNWLQIDLGAEYVVDSVNLYALSDNNWDYLFLRTVAVFGSRSDMSAQSYSELTAQTGSVVLLGATNYNLNYKHTFTTHDLFFTSRTVVDSTPTLSGTLDASLCVGEVLAVYLAGVRLGVAQINDGQWQFRLGVDGDSVAHNAPLAMGTHQFKVQIENASASTVRVSRTMQVTMEGGPSAVNLTNALAVLSEGTSTLSRTKLADIVIADDAWGVNEVALTGADAQYFERVGTALYLKSGVSLDFEKKASYALTVAVTDAAANATISTNYSLNVTNVNEAPTAIALANALSNLQETNSTTRIKLADVVVADDGIGSNALSLGGADADSFELLGNALYLKQGTTLNHLSKPSLAVTVNAADSSVAGSTPLSTTYSLLVGDSTLPVFSSGGVGQIREGSIAGTVVYDGQASDDGLAEDVGITYALSGKDQGWFAVNAATGVVSMRVIPSASSPVDENHDGVYDIVVNARDASGNVTGKAVRISLYSAAQIIWGDGSGWGKSPLSSPPPLPSDGGAGADSLMGTTGNDIVFGDGSGGGVVNYGTTGGSGGGGLDVINGADGNDLIFGDGFSTADAHGGYGGGAGAHKLGGTAGFGFGGIGAGNGAWGTTVDGTDSWLGPVNKGSRYQYTAQGYNFPASGNSGGGVRNGNVTEGSMTDAVSADLGSAFGASASAYGGRSVYDKVLWDLSQGTAGFGTGAATGDTVGSGNGGTNIDQRVYNQATGAGADILRGGRGNDWLMGGGGTDTLMWYGSDLDQGTDYVVDFSTAQSDVIGLAHALSGYSAGANINAWVSLEHGLTANSPFAGGGGAYSRLRIDREGLGNFTTPEQTIVLRGDALSAYADAQAMHQAGRLQVFDDALELSLHTVHTSLASLIGNKTTGGRIKLADLEVKGDSTGVTSMSLSGVDAASFEIANNALYLKAGVGLDSTVKAQLGVTVNVSNSSAAWGGVASADYTLAVTAFDAEAARDAGIYRIRQLQLTPTNFSQGNWDNPSYSDWVDYLVNDITATEYASRRAASGNDKYHPLDVYGLAQVGQQPINWSVEPGTGNTVGLATNSIWDYYSDPPYVGTLAIAYNKTRDTKYLNRYLEIWEDMALHERQAANADTIRTVAYNRSAQRNLAVFLQEFVVGMGVFAKNLENPLGTTAIKGYVDSLAPNTNALTEAQLDSVNAQRFMTVVQGLLDSYASLMLATYSTNVDTIYASNLRYTGISWLLYYQYLFPELTSALAYSERAEDEMTSWLRRFTYPDGGMLEASLNYNYGTAEAIKGITYMAQDSDWRELAVQTTTNYPILFKALATPAGSTVQVGNGIWAPSASVPSVVSTEFTDESLIFPYAGHYMQRSGWGKQDALLYMYDKREFNGHTTAGGDSIQLFAAGKPLLVSGGISNYFNDAVVYPKSIAYLAEKSSWKTNTIVVDGISQNSNVAHQVYTASTTTIDTRWLDTPSIDYMESNWRNGYVFLGDGVVHQRKAVFLQDMQTWIVVDVMQAVQQHNYTQIWKFAYPLMSNGVQTQGFYKNQVNYDEANHRVVAADGMSDSSVNLSIRQFSPHTITYAKHWGEDGGDYGYYGTYLSGEPSFSVDVHATFSGSSTVGKVGDAVVISVLRPFTGVDANNDGVVSAVQRSTGDVAGVDLVFANGRSVSVSASTELTTLSAGGVSVAGSDLLVVQQGLDIEQQVLTTGLRTDLNASYLSAGNQITPLVVPNTFYWQDNGDGTRTEVINDLQNTAPTAVSLSNVVASVSQGTTTTSPLKLADIAISDDGLGTSVLGLSGASAGMFTVLGKSLYLKSGAALTAGSHHDLTLSAYDAVLSTSAVTTTYQLDVVM